MFLTGVVHDGKQAAMSNECALKRPRPTAKTQLKKLIISAMLVALGVVLGRILSVPIASPGGVASMNIGFGTLPILLLCCLYGPLWGAVGAFAWDILAALLFPLGAFNPAFSVSALIFGLVCGLFFIKCDQPPKAWRILLACAVSQIVYSVILNTLLLIFFYSLPWQPLLLARLIENAIMIPINFALVTLLVKLLLKQRLLIGKA